MKQIIKNADESMDTYKEITIISKGLEKYPNSPDLKLYLAFSFSNVIRISDEEAERKQAANRAIKLCREILDTNRDTNYIDRALDLMIRIYEEIKEYDRAEEYLSMLSADRYDSRIVGMVHLLGQKNDLDKQAQYAEVSLWKMYWTMNHVFESITHTMIQKQEYRQAIAYCTAHEKLLSIFDDGCSDFYVGDKLFVCHSKAYAYMRLGNKENCLESLTHYAALAKDVKQVATLTDFRISARNPLYFSNVGDNILEEYISRFTWKIVFLKYDDFLGDNEEYQQIKATILAKA